MLPLQCIANVRCICLSMEQTGPPQTGSRDLLRAYIHVTHEGACLRRNGRNTRNIVSPRPVLWAAASNVTVSTMTLYDAS